MLFYPARKRVATVQFFKRGVRLVAWICLGGLVGLLIAWAQLAGYTIYWQDLGRPPIEARRIAGANLWGVWLETTSGKLYYLPADNITQGGWSDIDPQRLKREHTVLPGEAPRRSPAALSGVTDRREVYSLRDNYTLYSQYALRSDGHVLVWQDWPTPTDRTAITTYPIGGALLFAILAMVIGLGRWLSELGRRSAVPNQRATDVLQFPRFGRW